MKNTLSLPRITSSFAVSASRCPFSDQAAIISFFVSNKRDKATRPLRWSSASTRYYLGEDLPHECRLAPVEPRDVSNEV